METFSSQLTTLSLYKLAISQSHFLPYITSSELACDVTATCNRHTVYRSMVCLNRCGPYTRHTHCANDLAPRTSAFAFEFPKYTFYDPNPCILGTRPVLPCKKMAPVQSTHRPRNLFHPCVYVTSSNLV